LWCTGRPPAQGALEGDFDKARGRALVRVYAGTPTLTQTLAIGRGISAADVPHNRGKSSHHQDNTA